MEVLSWDSGYDFGTPTLFSRVMNLLVTRLGDRYSAGIAGSLGYKCS